MMVRLFKKLCIGVDDILSQVVVSFFSFGFVLFALRNMVHSSSRPVDKDACCAVTG